MMVVGIKELEIKIQEKNKMKEGKGRKLISKVGGGGMIE